MSVLDRLLNDLGTTRRGLMAFFGLGVADGSFLPLPIEPFVLPVMAAHPRRVWAMTLALLAGCMTGAFLFYLLGALAQETVVEPLLAMLGLTDEFAAHADDIRDNSFLKLFLIGLTPIPMQVGTLGAGVLAVDPLTFLVAMGLARVLRYGALAVAALVLGIGAAAYLQRNRGRIVLGSMAVIGLGLALGQTVDL